MTYKKKLLVTFCIMAAPLPLVGAQALWSVREQAAALGRLQLTLARAQLFADVESLTYRKVRRIRDYVGGQDPTARAQFEGLDAQSRSKLAIWKAATDDHEDLELLRSFEQLDGQLVGLASHAFTLVDDGKQGQALKLLQEELNDRLLPALDTVVTAIYTRSRTRSVHRALDELESTGRATTLLLVASIAVAVLFSGLFSFVTARNLARPVEQLKTVMDKVGEGEFEQVQALDVGGRDEIGDLARAFVRTAQRLRGTQQDLRSRIDTLRQTQSQLVQSEKLASLGQMAAAVAHGLRNPLASIRAATQLSLHRLSAGGPAGPLAEQLTAVIDEVDRLEKRIEHLLDFTRPTAVAPSPTSVRELLESVARVFDEKLSAQGVHLRLGIDSSLPEVFVDAAQIEQAVVEVVANALEAMPGGGSLSVEARRWGSEDERGVEIAVEDTGEGIPARTLPRVSDPFFTTKADGTGLGLATARRFVEQNQGEFVIASVEAKGTVVTIRLPAFWPAAAPAR